MINCNKENCRNDVFPSVCGECERHSNYEPMESKPSYEQLESELSALREQLSQLQRELGEEQEAHAQLQARCFDGGGSQSVFDRVAELKRQLDEAAKHEAAAWIARHKLDLPDDGNLHIYYIKSDAEKWLSQYQSGFAWLEPLYRLPPNLPALIAAAKQEERKRCLNAINSHIVPGDLEGNGFDMTAQRNGMILAHNLIMELKD